MEGVELEITIEADGRTRVHMKGVKGPDCLSVSKALEEIVGRLEAQTPTAEHYEPPADVRADLRLENR